MQKKRLTVVGKRGSLSSVVTRMVPSFFGVILTDSSPQWNPNWLGRTIHSLLIIRVPCLVVLGSVSCVEDGLTTSHPVRDIGDTVNELTVRSRHDIAAVHKVSLQV